MHLTLGGYLGGSSVAARRPTANLAAGGPDVRGRLGAMTENLDGATDPVGAAEQADVPEQAEQLSQEQPYDSLVDRGVEDVLDEGFSPPEQWSSAERYGNTPEEQREGESLEERLRQEVPDDQHVFEQDREAVLSVSADDDFLDDGEVGDARAGRLVDPDQGIGIDEERGLVGDDVGIDGAGASAEEAAVHIVDDGAV